MAHALRSQISQPSRGHRRGHLSRLSGHKSLSVDSQASPQRLHLVRKLTDEESQPKNYNFPLAPVVTNGIFDVLTPDCESARSRDPTRTNKIRYLSRRSATGPLAETHFKPRVKRPDHSGSPSLRRLSAMRSVAPEVKTIACLNFEIVKSG